MSVQPRVQAPRDGSAIHAVPRSVVALGLVSLFMDISSEIIHSLLPVFLITVIGASALSVGFIEGFAEAASQVTKLFAGAISDWMGKRKPLILAGYGLSALTKPLFPLASGVGVVAAARFIDRIGKGVRGAPRDALIGDITPVELRGTAFGLRQAMDTVGAFVGPLLAMLLMAASSDNFRLVFWVAVLPAVIAVLLIIYGVQEPDAPRAAERRRFPGRRAELGCLDRAYWWLVGIAAVLTFARFSEAFLLLAAEHVGLAIALIPGVLVVMNAAYAVSAYPFGRLADAVSRRLLLALGAGFLIAADIVLATAGTPWQGGCRGRLLGPAHGGNARAAGRARGRRRTGRSARHRARHVQSDNRCGIACGERPRRLAVDSLRPRCNLYRGSCICRNGRDRHGILASAEKLNPPMMRRGGGLHPPYF